MLSAASLLVLVSFSCPLADRERVEEILSRPEAGSSVDELRRDLVLLGRAAIPDLFAILASGRCGGADLDAGQEELLLDALASFGPLALRPFVESRLAEARPSAPSPTLSVGERAALLDLIGRYGAAADVRVAIRTASPGGDDGFDARLGRVLGEGVGRIIGRDPGALREVASWILHSHPRLAAVLIEACGKHPSRVLLSILADHLDFDRELDPVLLAEIGRVAESLGEPADEGVCEAVRGYLDDSRPEVVRLAVLAAGSLEDFESAAELIELLEHEEPAVAGAASLALARLTGMRFQADARRWESWLRSESLWLERDFPRLAPLFADGPAEEVLRALGEVSQRRIRRHELAREVEASLGHENAVVRRLACVCLERLGSVVAKQSLVRALQDEEESVSEAARSALLAMGFAPTSPVGGSPENPPESQE